MSDLIRRGDENNAVLAVQNALNQSVGGTPLVLDGIFGPLTEAAVKTFQKSNGLAVDGLVGPKTLGRMFIGVTMAHTILLAVAKPKAPARQGSVWSPPRLRPGAAEPQLSFGACSLVPRDAALKSWLSAPCPKPALSLPRLVPPPLVDPTPLSPLGRMLLPPLTRSNPTKRLPLSEKLSFEATVGVKTEDFEKLELATEMKLFIPRAKQPKFVPKVTLTESPDGSAKASLKLALTPFEIPPLEWGRAKLTLSPIFEHSLTLPYRFGFDTKDIYPVWKTELGAEAELKFRLTRDPDLLNLLITGKGGMTGALKFKDGKVEGDFKGAAEVGAKLELKFDIPFRR